MKKDIWIEKSPQDYKIYFFKNLGNWGNGDNSYRGELISMIPGSQLKEGLEYPFLKKHSRKLEDWEVIKYKLQGII